MCYCINNMNYSDVWFTNSSSLFLIGFSHLLHQLDHQSQNYAWWDLSVQYKPCCFGHNVLGWEFNSQTKWKWFPLHPFEFTMQHLGCCVPIKMYYIQHLPKMKKWLSLLDPHCPALLHGSHVNWVSLMICFFACFQ